jgi:lysozyme
VSLRKQRSLLLPIGRHCPAQDKLQIDRRLFIADHNHLNQGRGEQYKTQQPPHEEGVELLRIDAQIAEAAVVRLIRVPLTDGQFDALVSFTFNLGAGALQRSTLRRRANRGEHEAAAGEFKKWIWAAGKRLPGLVTRRRAESALYGT